MSCQVCGEKTGTKCSGCGSVFYCSKQHQKADWPSHKESCLPFTVGEDGVVGRHLVARRRLAAGEVVLRERPLVAGPPQTTGPVCLGCYAPLAANSSTPCPKCGWPLCSLRCAEAPQHRAECWWAGGKRKGKVKISQFVSPHPTYACLLPLRCLYLRSGDPAAWARLLSLESHAPERADSEKERQDRFGVVDLIRRLYDLGKDFTEQEMLNVCGILQINGHEVPLSGSGYVAVYWRGSLVEHSCLPTCSKSFGSSGQLVLRAAADLEPGGRLSICYTDPLWGTPHRRHHLAQSKFFWCRCPRCSDPTEMGTYLSAIRCTSPSCGKGKMLPPTFLIDSEEGGPDWVCGECGATAGEAEVAAVLARLADLSAAVNKEDPASIKTFLRAADNIVPENHYQVTEMSIALAQLYGQVNPGGLQELDDDSLQHKEQLCKRLISLAEKLVPAECRLRGVLYFELHASVAERTRRQGSKGVLDKSDVRNQLLESKRYLDKSYDLLRYEPEVLPEGKIAKQALENMKDLENLLRGLHLTTGDTPL